MDRHPRSSGVAMTHIVTASEHSECGNPLAVMLRTLSISTSLTTDPDIHRDDKTKDLSRSQEAHC